MKKIKNYLSQGPNHRTLFLLILLIFTNSSCSQNQEDSLDFEPDLAAAFLKFDLAIKNESTQFNKWLNSVNYQKMETEESSKIKETLIESLTMPSFDLLKEIGFTDDELDEIFGSHTIEGNQDEIVGAALILYNLQIDNWEENKAASSDANQPLAVACFLEATGIAAGVGLLGALTGQLGGKALRKAFIKAAKKIGTRFLGGFGLILIAAEFTWCMTR